MKSAPLSLARELFQGGTSLFLGVGITFGSEVAQSVSPKIEAFYDLVVRKVGGHPEVPHSVILCRKSAQHKG